MLNSNYFAIFGIEPSFNIDEAILRKRYYALQQQVHPDSFDNDEAQSERSMAANEAYYNLLSPLSRAVHLLHIAGIELGHEGDNWPVPESSVLAELMDLREEVEETQEPKGLLRHLKSVESDLSQLWGQFSEFYEAGDYHSATKALVKAQYWTKLTAEIKHKLSLLDYNHAD